MKKCGYSFWGYLGDIKYDKEGKEASTPDGNAFYSWCIIRELQKRGYEVTQIMPDRDDIGYNQIIGNLLFDSWLRKERIQAYTGTKKINWWNIAIDVCKKEYLVHKDKTTLLLCIKNRVIHILENECKDMEFILHEYRMLIPGRNDLDSVINKDWQPDYLIQECLFEYCIKSGKKLILFDLDYKLDYRGYVNLREKGCNACIFELGTKWQRLCDDVESKLETRQVYIPFDFDNINYFSDNRSKRDYSLIYVGNRYERDWCIDKYIPENLDKCIIYGNWLESNRDSKEKWPKLHFGERLQTRSMRNVYANSVATILLAKEEYCMYGFMTARLLEAIFYGTVPFFIKEFGKETIYKYAGLWAEFLTVKSKDELMERIKFLRNEEWMCEEILKYLREYLEFMDVRNFVDIIEEVK
ncbi:MAG: hypothetical protein K2N51_05080 [Lachnospiraceae bacterium]|nr:hypothetical protein [Lachnospiraceae bacterium]